MIYINQYMHTILHVYLHLYTHVKVISIQNYCDDIIKASSKMEPSDAI